MPRSHSVGSFAKTRKAIAQRSRKYYASAIQAVAPAATIVVVFAILISSLEGGVQIGSISVPEELSRLGYTREAVALMLQDRLRVIEDASPTNLGRQAVAVEGRQPDLKIPGTEVSIGTVISYLKAFFGHPDTKVVGEILQEGNGEVWFLLQVEGRDNASIREQMGIGPVKLANFDSAVEQAAEEILRLLQPFMLVSYQYYKIQNKPSCERTKIEISNIKEQLRRMTRTYPDKDKNTVYAYNLWGILLENEKRYDEAINKFNHAIDRDPVFAPAFSNLANAQTDKALLNSDVSELDRAVSNYRRAIAFSDRSSSVFYSLGLALKHRAFMTNRSHDLDEAIERFNQAVIVDPRNSDAFYAMGTVLAAEGKTSSAIASFRRAIAIKPGYPKLYEDLSSALQTAGEARDAENVRNEGAQFAEAARAAAALKICAGDAAFGG
jgi:tetratricopeptide (TPR) repeat protein